MCLPGFVHSSWLDCLCVLQLALSLPTHRGYPLEFNFFFCAVYLLVGFHVRQPRLLSTGIVPSVMDTALQFSKASITMIFGFMLYGFCICKWGYCAASHPMYSFDWLFTLLSLVQFSIPSLRTASFGKYVDWLSYSKLWQVLYLVWAGLNTAIALGPFLKLKQVFKSQSGSKTNSSIHLFSFPLSRWIGKSYFSLVLCSCLA